MPIRARMCRRQIVSDDLVARFIFILTPTLSQRARGKGNWRITKWEAKCESIH